jgi:hypothetical protein
MHTIVQAHKHTAGTDTVLLTSQWYCQAAVLAVNISTGQVAPITPVDRQASYSLASIAGGGKTKMIIVIAFNSVGRLGRQSSSCLSIACRLNKNVEVCSLYQANRPAAALHRLQIGQKRRGL